MAKSGSAERSRISGEEPLGLFFLYQHLKNGTVRRTVRQLCHKLADLMQRHAQKNRQKAAPGRFELPSQDGFRKLSFHLVSDSVSSKVPHDGPLHYGAIQGGC